MKTLKHGVRHTGDHKNVEKYTVRIGRFNFLYNNSIIIL